MKRLKPRQERFCHRFVECSNASIAARIAGYPPQSSRNAGFRLLRQPRILERIVALQSEMAERHCRDVSALLGKLEVVYRRAIENHQFSAAARAIELQAKLAAPTGTRSSRSSTATAKIAANDDVPD